MSVAVGVYMDYGSLALNWRPESKLDRKFKQLCWTVLIIMLSIGLMLSAIDVPVEERAAKPDVSERIAQFIIEKEKIKQEEPKAEPKEEKKVLKKKPDVEKAKTKEQEQARSVAEKSGVLALSDQLSDLMDTAEVKSMLSGSLTRSPSNTKAATFDRSQVMAGSTSDSGGISSDEYIQKGDISSTQLAEYQRAKVKQTLAPAKTTGGAAGSNSNTRTREEIAFVFDQNKSSLYSSYNRARRTSPGLKGKIVLEITIAPGGNVTNVRIISSELNNPRLESSLVARIKNFNFGAKKVKVITVTYPIEFLP